MNQGQFEGLLMNLGRQRPVFKRVLRRQPRQFTGVVASIAQKLIDDPNQNRDQLLRTVKTEMQGGIVSAVVMGLITNILIDMIYRWLVAHDFVDPPL